MQEKQARGKAIINTSSKENPPSAGSIFFKATLLSLFFASMLLFISALGVFGFGYYKLNQFAKKAQTTVPELKTLVNNALDTTPKQTGGYKTILLLGVDSVANKPGSPELTDTILLLSVNINSGKINIISLPRDLWVANYQTRINALYEYGKEKYSKQPEQFSQEVISELTGIEINHTITLSLKTVAQIIDILGGIEVDVKEGFVDTEFPREDVDIYTVDNKAELYETITFKPGLQTMDGKTVLKYMRSRKSINLSQGTDIARSERQQQVVSALIWRMQKFSILKDIDALAQLYVLYTNTFEQQLSKLEVLATFNRLYPLISSINLQSHTLSIYPEDKNGSITNPPVSKYKGQWVYEIKDLKNFQAEIQSKLKD